MKKLKYLDKGLLFLTIALFAIGLVMIFSASNIAAFMLMNDSPYKYLIRQSVWLAVGLFSSFLVLTFSMKSYRYLSYLFTWILIGMMVFLIVKGQIFNSVKSWLRIGPIVFQPSELIKVVFIIWMASYYDKNKADLDKVMKVFVPLVIALIIAFLIFLQPDLGTMFIFVSIVGAIFLFTPIEKKLKIKITFTTLVIGGALGAFVLFGDSSLMNSNQKNRTDFKEPCSAEKFSNHGNQLCNGYIAINNGGLFGKGLGNSTQKYLYLSEAHTDFIFVIVVEELGALIAIGIIAMIFILIWRIIMIGRRAINNYYAVVCYAVAFYIFIHLFINLAGILGIMPLTGVPFPFISYGGSYTISMIIALALVQKINIESQRKNISRKTK